MNTPNVPLRFELTVEVPGTPDEVWAAIATANGISSWMIPTDLEEREGGAVAFHMGPDVSSEGTVTGWDPPRRLVYEEPEWAALAGQDPATVSPLVTEFLVEARSGGTCVVHVVSSAFGSGADWEREFFADMAKAWTPTFEHLRLYLRHFPGQQVTSLEVGADVAGDPVEVGGAVRRALGAETVGQEVEFDGSRAVIERLADENVVLRLTEPVPGILGFLAFGNGDRATRAQLNGYLFGEGAREAPAAYAERARPRWQAWFDRLAADVPAL